MSKKFMGYHTSSGQNGYVYILANYDRNVLYIGMTDDLYQRVWKHRNGEGSKFTKKYNVKYLMYVEKFPNINEAIEREKQLKNWKREWKLNLIKDDNPTLEDLWEDMT